MLQDQSCSGLQSTIQEQLSLATRWRYERRWIVWAILLALWIGVMFFSSTAFEGKAYDRALSQLVANHLRRYDKHDLYHQYHVHFLAEKNVHVVMFLVLAILLWRILPDVPYKVGVVFLCGALIGCCSEVAQCFFPGRDPALRYAFLNMTGTSIGTAISYSILKLSSKFEARPPRRSPH